MNPGLRDKIVVITGASRGIGRVLALAFAQEEAIVVAAARKERGPKSLDETVAQIAQKGGKALPVRCDVTVPEDVQALVATTLRSFGRIDVLVNNAGVLVYRSIVDLTIEEWDTVMDVNVKGTFLACKYALPSMMERRMGNIINISSSMGHRYTPRDLAYSSSKAALDRFTMSLAEEVREYNIAVNSFTPRRVLTDMTSDGTRPADPPGVVVPGVLWLAQQDANTFTGQVVDRREFGRTWGPGVSKVP